MKAGLRMAVALETVTGAKTQNSPEEIDDLTFKGSMTFYRIGVALSISAGDAMAECESADIRNLLLSMGVVTTF
jgi:hypothetical protein